MNQSIVVLLVALCATPSLATLFNFKQKFEAQRREPLPAPVYGAPAAAKYPRPPPDFPPPPQPPVSYSIPIQQYGPPKLNFGGGGFNKKFISGGHGNGHGSSGGHGSYVNFRGPSADKRVAPKPIYGPPRYGSPQPNFFQKKPSFPQKQFAPRPVYGPPQKTQGCDGWTPIVGPTINFAPQAEAHAAPVQIQAEVYAPSAEYGPPPPPPPPTPHQSYGPPSAPVEIHAPASSYGPPPAGLVQQPIIDEPHAPLGDNLHLPDVGPPAGFHNSIGGGIDFGSGGFDIVKSEGIEVSFSFELIDSRQ